MEPVVPSSEEKVWIPVGLLDESDCDFSKYRSCIGIYRASLDARIVYVGKAIELTNGGYQKRLRDYTRMSNSARNSKAGRLMNEHKSRIRIDVMIFPPDEIARAIAEEHRQIELLKPEWNSHGRKRGK